MTTINVHDAKTHLSQLLDRAHKGEEIILAKSGRPWARLVPLSEGIVRVPGRYKDELTGDILHPLPPEELEAWER